MHAAHLFNCLSLLYIIVCVLFGIYIIIVIYDDMQILHQGLIRSVKSATVHAQDTVFSLNVQSVEMDLHCGEGLHLIAYCLEMR